MIYKVEFELNHDELRVLFNSIFMSEPYQVRTMMIKNLNKILNMEND